MTRLRIATRGSELALVQAALVAEAVTLSARPSAISFELVVVETAGDVQRERPIGEIGGQGVFVKEVEQALLEERADLAVHSAKDLPSVSGADGLCIVAVPERGDPRDALVGLPMGELGPGARVASGAPRRRAQLAWLRPDLRFQELRGNIATRLAKVPEGGAVVVAYAALQRLGLAEMAAEVLSLSTMMPQVGQGALAVQCRGGLVYSRGDRPHRPRGLAPLPRCRAGLPCRARRGVRASRWGPRRRRRRRVTGTGGPSCQPRRPRALEESPPRHRAS